MIIQGASHASTVIQYGSAGVVTTGFAIGGVSPVGHDVPIVTYIDEDLLKLELIWAAAGHPNALFSLTPTELVEMTQGEVVCVV